MTAPVVDQVKAQEEQLRPLWEQVQREVPALEELVVPGLNPLRKRTVGLLEKLGPLVEACELTALSHPGKDFLNGYRPLALYIRLVTLIQDIDTLQREVNGKGLDGSMPPQVQAYLGGAAERRSKNGTLPEGITM